MSAPVLSKKEQKKSLSGIKSRKKTQKNVLAAPDIIKIRKPVLDEAYIPKLAETLEVLLSDARLPQEHVTGKSKLDNVTENSGKTSTDAKLKRNQLLPGINSISRGVNNESVACILFADDVKPKLLISHLIVLCSLKDIPYLYMENLRSLTKRTLGFSCIALGFKKDSTFFLPLISLIKLATESQMNNEPIQGVKNMEAFAVEKNIEETGEKKTFGKTEKILTYLYRNCNTKRAFVPDSSFTNNDQNDGTNFIPFAAEEELSKSFHNSMRKKISEGKIVKCSEDTIPENQTKNKRKHDVPLEYTATQIIKMGANHNRGKKKFLKLIKRKKL